MKRKKAGHNPPRPRTFASLFPASGRFTTKDGRPGWRVRGSGVAGPPEDAATTRAIVAFLEDAGVLVTRSGAGGIGGGEIYNLSARFLDGRLSGQTGIYFYGRKGVSISGAKAAVFVAKGLGLQVPVRILNEFALGNASMEDLKRELLDTSSQ